MAQHHIIKETGEAIGQLLQAVFKENGYKRVHLVVAAPKEEEVEGKLPALCIYLYNLMVDDEGASLNRYEYPQTEIGSDGKPVDVMKAGPLWVRLDYLVSTWAQTPEEEHLLMGCAIKGLIENPVIRRESLKGESFEDLEYIPVSLSQKLDEGVLSRFWASLNQPMKPAIQVWTSIPIYPSGGTAIQRVQDREVRFFDLNKLQRAKR